VQDIWNKERECYRGLHNNDQLHGLSSSSNIRVIKPSDIRWVGHVATNTQNGNAYGMLVWKPEVNSDSFEDLRLGGRTKLECKVIRLISPYNLP